MNYKELQKYVKLFEAKDFDYSLLVIWKRIITLKKSSYNLFRYADQLRLCGFYEKARKVFDSIDLSFVPDNKKYLFYLYYGQLLKDKGEYEEATSCFEKSVSFAPNATEPYVYLAEMLEKYEKVEKALPLLEKALEKEGEKDEIYFLFALCYIRLDNLQQAIESMEKCLNINPQYENAENLLEDFRNLKEMLETPSESKTSMW